ncbi:hypothetical protein OPV22_009102 [Ensete ventricosum]|uniref:Uncharacterized protein n=1 Tax=Ensete ventricosum TaxID=4639 RepID=A0AAV8PQI8_ENSVE|nr:hypothetical protein OPV22_009102 [Ensete ventricosum]
MAKHLNSAVAVLMAVACVLPSLAVAARNVAAGKQGFVVQGRVFCDTCRAGFETPVSTYTVGAKVRIECRSKATGAKTCNFEGTTDHTVQKVDARPHSRVKDTPLSVCAELLKNYEQYEV